MEQKPMVAVEYGGYVGYSAVLIGSNLPPEGKLYSIEINPLFAAIATKIVEFAGLSDKVKAFIFIYIKKIIICIYINIYLRITKY